MTDIDKFKKVLEILPEEVVRGMLHSAVSGTLDIDVLEKLINFEIYSENVSAKFINEKVNHIFKNFASESIQVTGFIDEKILNDKNRKQQKIKLNGGIQEHLTMLCSSLLNSYEDFIRSATWFLVSPPEQDGKKSKIISYNKITGLGHIDHLRFKFKDHQPEFRLFGALFENINNVLSKQKVQELIGGSPFDWTQHITAVVTKIKRRTKLTKDDLIQNNGNLTLVGTKEESN